MIGTIDDYDKKLARKDEIIRLGEGELKRKDALLKLHKNKRKSEGSAPPEGAWRLVIDELVAKQACLESEILRLQEELEEEADISEAGGESVAEC